jgi:hypothetical protein
MADVDKRRCKVCNIVQNRILDGKFNQKDKRYRGDTPGYWNGSVCPSCNKVRVKTLMKVKRSNKRSRKVAKVRRAT